MATTRYPVIAVLKVRAKRLGITQRELEQRTGLRQSHISDILSGKGDNPTLVTLEKLSEALGLGVAILDKRGIPVTPLCECDHATAAPIPGDFTIRVTHKPGKRSISIEEA